MEINWGKPKIEICAYENGVLPSNPQWVELDTPVNESVQMNTEDGDKREALEEGGGVVDTYRNKSKFSFTFTLFQKKNKQKPIEDNDGIIETNYALRVTPEDEECPGFILKKCSVSFTYSFNSTEGGRFTYTFDALVPDDGSKMCQEYKAQS